MGHKTKQPLKIMYILEIFPEISETFILQEILGVKHQGVNVCLISLHHPKPGQNHQKSNILIPYTIYLPNIPRNKQYKAFIYMFLRNPFRLISFAKYLYGIEKYIRDTWNSLLETCYLCRLAKKEKIDNIHAHFANPTTSFALWINMLTGIPFTFASHGYDIYYVFPKDMKLKTEKSRKHLTVSRQAMRDIQSKIGPCDGKLDVIYSGIDTKGFIFNPDQNRKNILLHVARLHPVKGQEQLIQACGLLKERIHNLQCLIIGEGPQRLKLEKLIKELNLEKTCILLGAKTHEEIIPYYRSSKVFALTSISEGLGNVLKESLACGLAVVAPKIGGIPEIVRDGYTGYLYKCGDVKELAEKIFLLWTNPLQRLIFTQNGRELIEKEFDYMRQTEKLIKVWEHALS